MAVYWISYFAVDGVIVGVVNGVVIVVIVEGIIAGDNIVVVVEVVVDVDGVVGEVVEKLKWFYCRRAPEFQLRGSGFDFYRDPGLLNFFIPIGNQIQLNSGSVHSLSSKSPIAEQPKPASMKSQGCLSTKADLTYWLNSNLGSVCFREVYVGVPGAQLKQRHSRALSRASHKGS